MINILQMINREMKIQHINMAELSRKLNLHYSTVIGMLSRPTIQVQKLAELSEVLQYNFFKEIANELPYERPKFQQEEKQQGEIEKLKEQNKMLEMKVEVLQDMLNKIIAPKNN